MVKKTPLKKTPWILRLHKLRAIPTEHRAKDIFRLGWAGFGSAWSGGRLLYPWQGVEQMSFKVLSHPTNDSKSSTDPPAAVCRVPEAFRRLREAAG